MNGRHRRASQDVRIVVMPVYESAVRKKSTNNAPVLTGAVGRHRRLREPSPHAARAMRCLNFSADLYCDLAA